VAIQKVSVKLKLHYELPLMKTAGLPRRFTPRSDGCVITQSHRQPGNSWHPPLLRGGKADAAIQKSDEEPKPAGSGTNTCYIYNAKQNMNKTIFATQSKLSQLKIFILYLKRMPQQNLAPQTSWV